jgi:hypothetical protein
MGCCDGSEAMPDIKPLHPAILANALEGNIHKEVGRSRAAKSTKIRKNMMLKNSLKTWQILAPNEVKYVNDTLYLLNSIEEGIACIEQGLLPYEQDVLQGYLQRCIEAREWVSSLRIFPDGHAIGRVWVDDEDETDYTKSLKAPVNALLTAYLAALAAQRPITTGRWQHFKGDCVPVKAIAHWNGQQLDSSSIAAKYKAEESTENLLQLTLKGEKDWSYRASRNFGDRVFYVHNGDGWARATENFLGLVDAKHPDHEGLLRFVEVAK